MTVPNHCHLLVPSKQFLVLLTLRALRCVLDMTLRLLPGVKQPVLAGCSPVSFNTTHAPPFPFMWATTNTGGRGGDTERHQAFYSPAGRQTPELGKPPRWTGYD